MIGLSGSLQAVGFRALTGFLGDLGKSGTLRISHHQWSGEVVYDRGEVVGAAMGAERGLAALDAIALALPEGEFAFVDAPPGSPPEGGREVSLSPPALQARLDELLGQPAAGADILLTPATVPSVVQGEGALGPALPAGQVALTRGAIQTLLAVDGKRTVAEIAAGRGLAETIKDLQSLVRQGLIAVPPAPAEAPPAEAPPAEAPAEAPAPGGSPGGGGRCAGDCGAAGGVPRPAGLAASAALPPLARWLRRRCRTRRTRRRSRRSPRRRRSGRPRWHSRRRSRAPCWASPTIRPTTSPAPRSCTAASPGGRRNA